MDKQRDGLVGTPAILLAATAMTGIVDAVSFLSLGHVFTANMTGNIVFLGFALGGAPGVSIPRSLLALICFSSGALVGGKMTTRMDPRQYAVRSLGGEAVLLFAAAAIALGLSEPLESDSLRLDGIVALTAIAMGLRNAVVRKLAVADLTTTVLTLTITGLAADSSLAGGDNPRWQRRCGAILAMLGGAAVGAVLLRRSVALPLCVCGVVAAACAVVRLYIEPAGTK